MKEKDNQNTSILHHFQQLIEQHFVMLRLPKDYAALLYITPHQLNTITKETIAKPAGELIRDRVLLEAKRLLINFDLPIGEIAHWLSFPDHSYFIKFFHKYTSMTPEAFRQSHYR